MPKPTEKEILAALGTVIAEYWDADEMLDGFMSCAEPTPAERKRQRDSNRMVERMAKLYMRAVA